MKHYLFSYGTLQLEKVQIESFGRKLKGGKDLLTGYRLENLEFIDEDVLEKSGRKFHPIAVATRNPENEIEGMLFEITEEKLFQADQYEVSDYKRIYETFKSGK